MKQLNSTTTTSVSTTTTMSIPQSIFTSMELPSAPFPALPISGRGGIISGGKITIKAGKVENLGGQIISDKEIEIISKEITDQGVISAPIVKTSTEVEEVVSSLGSTFLDTDFTEF